MTPLKQQLAELHDQLANSQTPDAETRQLLGVVLADISRVLHSNDASGTSAAETIESVAARFDVDHPALSGAIRQLVDALGKAGI